MTDSGVGLDILAIFAHPDDAALVCGGALVKASREGKRVGALDLTRGEAGSAGTPELRATEALAASQVMGLATRQNAALPDSQLTNDHAARVVVANLIRQLRPRVVVTHWSAGRHPDHRVAAALAYDAAFLAGLKNFGRETGSTLEAHRPETVVYATAFRGDAEPPSFVIDITDTIDRKIEAIACYASQFDGKTRAGEVLPGGDRPLPDQIRAHAARTGARIGVEYGEPYRVLETLRMPSLAELAVHTF